MRSGRTRGVLAAIAVTLGLLAATAPAEAAFPGQNGRIAYSAYLFPHDIYTIDPSGVTQLNVSRDPGDSVSPAFSPDGTRLAYVSGPERDRKVYVSGVYGQDPQVILDPPGDVTAVAWSPVGDRMIAAIGECDPLGNCPNDLWVFNTDGTGLEKVVATPNRHEESASWSPDGTTIAVGSADMTSEERDIWIMAPDGSGQQNLTTWTFVAAVTPDWLPDGSKIAFSHGGSSGGTVSTMDPDGTNVQVVTNGGFPAWSPDGSSLSFSTGLLSVRGPAGEETGITRGTDPDWQPVQGPPTPPPAAAAGYPRPKGADAVDVSLVPSYLACTTDRAVNREHGPPLAFPSCAPPKLRNSFLSVGTPDANGQPAKAYGRLRVATVRGDPATPADEADVLLEASQLDVRRASGYTDYGGVLNVKTDIRVTDRFNAGGPEASGTIMDYPVRFSMPCTATADTTVGATCSATTSVEALTPGAVRERGRAVWGVDQVKVYFPADPNNLTDDQLFLTQGIFVP